MRGFIVLCFCAVTMAAPQGYKYNPHSGVSVQQLPFVGHASNGFAGTASSPIDDDYFQGGQSSVQQTGFGGHNIQRTGPGGHGIQQTGFGDQGIQQTGFGDHGGHSGHQTSFSGQNIHQSALGGQAMYQTGFGGQNIHQSGFGNHNQQQSAIVSKRFFIHSAPEESDEEIKEKHITVGVPRKNYNVVFIKSPVKSNNKAAIKIRPAPNEEKTVIYVLSKKTDSSDIQAEVIEHPTTTTKPQVFFIKYKTNEEARHAQEQIQAQYDALGGTSQISDEGIAPVSSVIGSLDSEDAGAYHGAATGDVAGDISGTVPTTATGLHPGSAQSSASKNNAYLPPNFK